MIQLYNNRSSSKMVTKICHILTFHSDLRSDPIQAMWIEIIKLN